MHAAPGLALAVVAAFLATNCFGRDDEPFAVDLTVERGGLEIPDRVDLEIMELAEPGGALLASEPLSVDGPDFFRDAGNSNRIRIEPSVEAGAVRVRAEARAAGTLVATGVVEVTRASRTVPAFLYLVAVIEDDAGPAPSDAGP